MYFYQQLKADKG